MLWSQGGGVNNSKAGVKPSLHEWLFKLFLYFYGEKKTVSTL